MDKRRLMMTGVVAGSVGLGSLIGAFVFAPGIGLASEGGTDGPVLTICGGAAGSLDAAAEAIGIATSELLRLCATAERSRTSPPTTMSRCRPWSMRS